MADPQKLKLQIEKAVSARADELRASLVEEISGPVMSAVKEAEDEAATARGKISAAEERAKSLEKKLKDAEAALEEARAKASAPGYEPGSGPTDLLNAAVASIADATAQSEILKVTLDGIAQFAARTALYVMKGGQPTGWQSRGFDKESAIKGATMDASSGLVSRAINDREPVSAAAAEFSSEFVSTHGNPADGNATVLPLVVREKVSALIYVDGGAEGKADLSAARVLVRTAALWLEVLALRKAAGSGAAEAEAADAAPAARASAAPAVEPAPAPPAGAAAAAAAAPASASPADIPAEDAEVHKKAKRFAKLLVDEIKLYNQKKVEEGKKNKDLYTRLKEDIDKSRQTYEKRWGSSPAASANYFHAELVRVLADGDESALGM